MPVGHPEDGVEAVDGGGDGQSMKVTGRGHLSDKILYIFHEQVYDGSFPYMQLNSC